MKYLFTAGGTRSHLGDALNLTILIADVAWIGRGIVGRSDGLDLVSVMIAIGRTPCGKGKGNVMRA
jgi:hypothetical protein